MSSTSKTDSNPYILLPIFPGLDQVPVDACLEVPIHVLLYIIYSAISRILFARAKESLKGEPQQCTLIRAEAAVEVQAKNWASLTYSIFFDQFI
jgi:hypothetical protein